MKTIDIKRMAMLCSLAVMCVSAALAQSAGSVLNKTISAYNSAKGLSAQYTVTSTQGNSSGKIEMRGNKFRITSADLKCWYDGATQWTYSTATGEVNVTNPTAEEMQMSNPYVALSSLKSSCNVYKAYTQVKGFYTLKLVPKKKNTEIKQLLLYLADGSYNISKASFELNNGTKYVLRITDYKTVSLSESTFRFDKSMVPAGTEVVDLR